MAKNIYNHSIDLQKIEIRNSNTIPSVKVIKGSADQDIDFAATKLAIPFVVSEMSKSGINKILLTINWR